MNFEINLIFLFQLSFVRENKNKSQNKNLNILRTNRAFKMKYKFWSFLKGFH